MFRRILLPTIFLILGYGFWVSPDFKEIAAGVAIFLFGMIALEEGFKAFTGGLLERILKRTTDRLWKSLSFGILTTTVMQSSSLVSVITISFLSAGLLGLGEGIGIIFGANLGTTTGAWLVAGFGLKVDIGSYAMPMLVFGVILIFQSSKILKGIGYVLAGLGFLFLGIHHMKEGFEAFKSTIDLTEFAITGFIGLLTFTLVGVFATVVMQSSHATLVLIITALASQQISYENALALAIGANIGTTITAIIGAMSANVEGKRLAGAHLIFNAVTGLVAIVFIHQLVWAVDEISATVHIAADDYTLKLAVFHTLFNLIGVALMVPFINQLVRLLGRIFPAPADDTEQPRFLSDTVMEIPDAAIEAVRKEILHLYENAFELIAHGLSIHRSTLLSEEDLESALQHHRRLIHSDTEGLYERKMKVLYGAIVEFITRSQARLPPEWGSELYALRQASRDIVEAVKDVKHLQKNLLRYLKSENPHIRREYQNIQLQLGRVLREIAAVGLEEGDAVTILSLDGIKLSLEQSDVLLNGSLDRLIRDNLINAQMATSLMNDNSYAYDIGRNLISMAETLFAVRDRRQQGAEKALALDDTDINRMLDGKGE